jgi:hypothetical protein
MKVRGIQTPGILRFNEKHGDRYFIYHNEEELHRACQHVMKERLNDGYWYDMDDPDTKAEIEAALEDPKLAYRFILNRGDYEYEYVYLERAEEY